MKTSIVFLSPSKAFVYYSSGGMRLPSLMDIGSSVKSLLNEEAMEIISKA